LGFALVPNAPIGEARINRLRADTGPFVGVVRKAVAL
jgi:hypothetical protein